MRGALRLAVLFAVFAAAHAAKLAAPRFWVKRPGLKKLQIVDSLAALCAENDLDEEEMLAVARGEADDCQGWECGEMDSEVSEEKEEDTTEADADADADADAEAEAEAVPEAATPAPPALGAKTIVSFAAPMLAVQLLKRFNEKDPNVLMGLRGCFTACVAVHTLVDLIVQERIKSANDTTPVEEAFNPMSMLFGGASSGPKSARAYDLEQLGKLRNSFRMGVIFVALLHWKFKYTQVLVYQAVQNLVELYFHPLIQIHLFGRPMVGAFSRPFGGNQPDMSALLKGLAGPGAAAPRPAAAS